MKYIVIDQTKTDWFTKEYNDRNAAIQACKDGFDRLTESDKRKREDYYVLESINPDEDADNHFDGTIVYKAM